MNQLSSFFTDVWYDLRDKRLWPVAALLLLAVIALPVFVLKPASEEPAPPAPASAPVPGAAPLPTAVSEAAAGDSRLDVFTAKDPFRPFKEVGRDAGLTRRTARTVADEGTGSSGDVPGLADTGISTGGSGESGEAPSSSDGASTGGGSGAGGGSGDTGGGSGSGGGDSGAKTPKPVKPKTYTYTVDLRFGQRGEVRERRGVQRLEVLPNERNPLLVFLGVSADGDEAVFLVNSDLKQEGEGACEPSRKDCTFLTLRTDDLFDEHLFTDPAKGRNYYLKLLDIDRVTVETAARRAKRSEDARSAGTANASGGGRRARSFHVPILGDFVEASPQG